MLPVPLLAAALLALRVGILGVSTTRGCGACDPTGALPGCNGTLGRCSVEAGWVGIVSRAHEVQVHVERDGAHYGAVPSACLAEHLDADREVILLDVLMSVPLAALGPLLRKVRRVAPVARVALIGWFGSRAGQEALWSNRTLHGVRVVRAWSQPPSLEWYALDASPPVHPNAGGHQRIAAAVLVYLGTVSPRSRPLPPMRRAGGGGAHAAACAT